MNNRIDERIVQMSFENKDFQDGIKESSKTLSEFDKTLANAGKSDSLLNLGSAATTISGKFDALRIIATTALTSIVNQAINAGQQLIKSLAIDPIMQGYQEYELKINSIRTMLASGKTDEGLPVTLEQVNKQLQELNEYSDQTIYSFSDMTQNIGKFTNAGVSLNKSVQAIKGIANAAALSGANSNEASRAMYNFAQALSSGYVKLIDWKSIELANMGTVEFKQQLLDAAVAAGTVEKTADGMYQVLTTNSEGKTMERTVSATKAFNESLEYQWMTTEVLTDTLTDYADATTAIGKRATEAATKVRTWSQLMDTTKEAVGSGWSETFELIVGNFDEATNLYTELSNVIGGFVQSSSDARNQIIKDWKALGGRTQIIIGIREAWDALGKIMKPIREAFSNVFPPVTGEALFKLSVAFKEFFSQIKIGSELAEKIKTIFQGLFSAISLGADVVKFVFDIMIFSIKELLSLLPEGAGNSILDFAVKIGKFFIELKESSDKTEYFVSATQKVKNAIHNFIKTIQDAIGTIEKDGLVEGLSKIIKNIANSFSWLNNISIPPFFTNFIKLFKEILEKLKPIVKTFKKYLGEIFKTIKQSINVNLDLRDFDSLVGILTKIMNLLLVSGVTSKLNQIIGSLTAIPQAAIGFLNNINSIFGGVRDTLKSYQDQLKAKILMEIATAVAVLTASLVVLSLIDPMKLSTATVAISLLFANLSGSIILISKNISTDKMGLLGVQLIALANSILIITGALFLISKIDSGTLQQSLMALGVIMAAMSTFAIIISKETKSFLMSALSMNLLALSIIEIVGAVALMSKIKPEALQQGIMAIGGIMAEMATFAVVMSKIDAKSFFISAIATNLFALAIAEMSGIVILLGNIEVKKIKQGLTALGAIFLEVAAFNIILSKTTSKTDLLESAAMLIAMGIALQNITGTISKMGNMDTSSLIQGLIGLAVALGIMTIAMKVLATPNVLMGAAALLAVALAIDMLVPAIIALGNVPIENIVTALLALAGVFAVIGVAALVLGPITPAIIAVAGAIALLGIAILAIGLGIGIAAAGLGLLALALAALAAGGTAAVAVIVAAISGIAMVIPFVLKKVAEGMVSFAEVIILGAPTIAKAIMSVLDNLLTLLITETPKLITTILFILDDLLTKLAEKIPNFVDAGMKIMLGFLTGIENNIQPIIESSMRLVTNYLNGITNEFPKLIKAGADMLIAFMQGMAEQEPRVVDSAFKMIISYINGLANAIRENTPALLEAVGNLSTAFIDGILKYFGIQGETSEKGKSVSTAIVQGLIDGLFPMTGSAVTALVNIGTAMIDGFKKLFQIASPSGLMISFGAFISQGLIDGILSLLSKIDETVKNLMTRITQPFKDNVNDYLNIGKNMAQGIIDGLNSKINDVVETVEELADTALKAIKDFLEIASPSKITTRFGKFFGVGFGNGVLDSISQVVDKVKTFGKTTLETMSSTTSNLANSLSNNLLDDAPIITPVLDLSAIKSGANSLSNLLNQGQTYNLAQATSASAKQFGVGTKNESNNIDSSTSIENNIVIQELAIRNDADIDKIAEKLYQKQQNAMRGKGLQTAFS